MTLRVELHELWERYLSAYRTGDAKGCASVFASDAVLTSPYGPVARGNKAIEALHADWTSEGGEDKALEIIEFGGVSDLAWCLARFSEGGGEEAGVSLNVFERQANGTWLIKMCSLNEE